VSMSSNICLSQAQQPCSDHWYGEQLLQYLGVNAVELQLLQLLHHKLLPMVHADIVIMQRVKRRCRRGRHPGIGCTTDHVARILRHYVRHLVIPCMCHTQETGSSAQ
jgi:hypothetical protein